jgi:hypothetical protein
MTDTEAVEAAYTASIKGLYEVMSTSFLMAKGNADKEKEAEEAFANALSFARKVRDRAKAVAAK